MAVKLQENEILSIDNFNMFAYYPDLWKTKSEKRNAVRQGIISNDGCTLNCIKLRIGAKDKSDGNAQDRAISDTYGNKFVIPFDFEMLDSALPFTNLDSETDCVMKLHSTITTELPYQQD